MSRDIREVVREERLMRGRLLELLGQGPLTVPELAGAGGMPMDEVMVWVMTMQRYGYVKVGHGPDSEGYFHYEAVAR